MLEKDIERKLVKETKACQGMCLKFISPSLTGIPDRIILLPEGKIGFVEVKGPGKRPRPIQIKRIKELRELGFKVFVLDNKSDIKKILDEIGGDAQ
ncbi:VRR-NUC domain-containing protein [Maledivibacter halophilus]|uniref:VRR-NUC domain-containing protein n=1 Tax=Maledivibacter halophilus TaxID=36842 RepID=A0A1T5K332_9FIRM|nr:VRR-NUC domain-containing protein [Maledivibacter halophilus]SKC57925.1 VRR-NUC domain-containing protein [Maledivibacter halophilus]